MKHVQLFEQFVNEALNLKEVQKMEKELQKMLAKFDKYEDDTEDEDGQERVDDAYVAIEDATLVIRARLISDMMDLEESVVINEAVKSADVRKFVKPLEKYASQLEELADEHGDDIADACYEAAELLQDAASRLEYI